MTLSGNLLTGVIPKELGNLAQLEIVAPRQPVDGCDTEGVGANLQSLDLSDNRLTGVIPKELGNLANLQSLDLSDNPGVIPPTCRNCTSAATF